MFVRPKQKHLFLLSHPEGVYYVTQDRLWYEPRRGFLKENMNLSDGQDLLVVDTIAERFRIPIDIDSAQTLTPFWFDHTFRFKRYKLKVIPVIVRTKKCVLRGSVVAQPLEKSKYYAKIDHKKLIEYRQQIAA